MGIFIKEDNGMSFDEAIENLMENIKKDYAKFSTHERMINEFNENVRFTTGRKYTKILNGTSVWGFIANGVGMLKGIPYEQGDVFMAATWRAPAKHVRGNIFSNEQNYFRWTGPNYRI